MHKPLPPMPPTEDRQDDAVEGHKECTNSWVRRNLEATDWLIDNHAAIRAAVCSQQLLLKTLEYVLHWHDQIGAADIERMRAAIANAKQPTQYNAARIAWELERTALGDGHYGNALRAAKDIPGLTQEDRSLLDRFASGLNGGTDHVALQSLALRIDSNCKSTTPTN